jgi:hypothetical protein
VKGVGETTPKAVRKLWRWSLVVEAFRERRGKTVRGVRYALMVAQWKGRGRARGGGGVRQPWWRQAAGGRGKS